MVVAAFALTLLAAACFLGLALSLASRSAPVEPPEPVVELRVVPHVPRQRVHVDSVVTSSTRQARVEERYAQAQARALPPGRSRRVRTEL
ncbi:MAG: hypothetical protein JWR42_2615 [Marmoricola sp.]|jgi:hypothetical protein|nr:hypothetical protein [Marmoricola sp.]